MCSAVSPLGHNTCKSVDSCFNWVDGGASPDASHGPEVLPLGQTIALLLLTLLTIGKLLCST